LLRLCKFCFSDLLVEKPVPDYFGVRHGIFK
jgi:hypothetical protein